MRVYIQRVNSRVYVNLIMKTAIFISFSCVFDKRDPNSMFEYSVPARKKLLPAYF